MLRLNLKEKVDTATQRMWFRDILGKSKVSVEIWSRVTVQSVQEKSGQLITAAAAGAFWGSMGKEGG